MTLSSHHDDGLLTLRDLIKLKWSTDEVKEIIRGQWTKPSSTHGVLDMVQLHNNSLFGKLEELPLGTQILSSWFSFVLTIKKANMANVFLYFMSML